MLQLTRNPSQSCNSPTPTNFACEKTPRQRRRRRRRQLGSPLVCLSEISALPTPACCAVVRLLGRCARGGEEGRLPHAEAPPSPSCCSLALFLQRRRRLRLRLLPQRYYGGDHKAPRSKHSATEQRRRSKINERFQILRDLIPQSDQKRDRATFLLEVIEYVKFLQQKAQKYEACVNGNWSQENAKLVPWSSNRVPVDFMPGASPTTKNCSAGNFLDNGIPATPEMLQNSETVAEPARLNADSIESQYQSQWQQFPCPADCPVSSEMGNEQEELTIDEGTITVSSVYSQNLFTALTNAMESSGIDLSQASITVQVNLGRRAISRRPNNMSSAKEQKDMPGANQIMQDTGQTRSCEESEQTLKRQSLVGAFSLDNSGL